MAEGHQLLRQVRGGDEGLVQELAGHGDLRGARQAQVGVGHLVDLRGLSVPRREAAGGDDGLADEVRGDVGHEAPLHSLVHRPLRQRHLQQRSAVLEVEELLAADLSAGLEVEEVESLPDLQVVLQLEARVLGGARLALDSQGDGVLL